jgi:hypothetical protein
MEWWRIGKNQKVPHFNTPELQYSNTRRNTSLLFRLFYGSGEFFRRLALLRLEGDPPRSRGGPPQVKEGIVDAGDA